MAEIVGAILSKNELPVLHSDVLVRVDKASGGASILQELTKEFSESSKFKFDNTCASKQREWLEYWIIYCYW